MARYKSSLYHDSKTLIVSFNKRDVDAMQAIMKQKGSWVSMSAFIREAVLRLIAKEKKEMGLQ